jgi:diguanylate cyclase (GGDEF)-like protein
MKHSGARNLRLTSVAWPFVLIVLLQAVFGTLSLQVASSLRAFVAGESLWSKGQHDALYYLNRYITTGDPAALAAHQSAMALPIGDREARLALEAHPPDIQAAFEGFSKGGNHAEDIPGLIWLFRYFRWVPAMDTSLTAWRTAEPALLKVAAIAASINEPTALSEAGRQMLLQELDDLNREITPLTKRFSDSLGEGIRTVQRLLFAGNIVLALAFILLIILRLKSFLSHRRRIEVQLSWSADHDQLTQLPNRHCFERELERLLRAAETPYALMFLDLDQFKAVNDSGGHAAGDLLLRRVAQVLGRRLHKDDLLARLGGDEFGLVVRSGAEASAETIAQDLCEEIEALSFVWEGQHYSISASIGLVDLRGTGLAMQEAMRSADIACHIAKEKGRNRVHVFEAMDSVQAQFTLTLGWVQRLRSALENDSFSLASQAIASLKPEAAHTEHCEILLRLEEGGKLIPPNSFIPAAERFGLMPAIDRWVVRTALDIIGSRPPAVRGLYSINLSGQTLRDETFVSFLSGELRRSNVPADVLCFEITETSAIGNFDDAISFMNAMRAMGCRFALDDFGVGMSSLTYLKRLPVDFVKIDGSFVRDMLKDRTDLTTVKMINQISHLSGRRTIAEFVENAEIIAALRKIGVDYVQGYAIGRPAPFERTPARSDARAA